MNIVMKVALSLLALGIVVFIAGPRPEIVYEHSFNSTQIPVDAQALDRYVDDREKSVSGIRPGLEADVEWHEDQFVKTDFAIVYLHGFSASRRELEPVPQQLAQDLRANLYLSRLSGHGRDGTAMSEPGLADWLNDVAEAIEIGTRLGNRVIILGVSTGATLATWAASQTDLAPKMEALILISPNYAVQGASTGLLNMPWASTILPMVFGKTRSFEPKNELHAEGWTTSYPSSAVFSLAALLRLSDGIDVSKISIPALFIYSTKDSVIVPKHVEERAREWGGSTSSIVIDDSEDPHHHVLAGDALSPATTRRVVTEIVNWTNRLPQN